MALLENEFDTATDEEIEDEVVDDDDDVIDLELEEEEDESDGQGRSGLLGSSYCARGREPI